MLDSRINIVIIQSTSQAAAAAAAARTRLKKLVSQLKNIYKIKN